MSTTLQSRLLHVFRTGRITVIGFEGRHLKEPEAVEVIRCGLLELIDSHGCEILVVDMTNVCLVSSWILGILAAVQSHGIDVELYHPSAEIREILSMTHLDRYLHVRETLP
jgi:anti-sigma B factor antagonist